jgi:hypothetical protein
MANEYGTKPGVDPEKSGAKLQSEKTTGLGQPQLSGETSPDTGKSLANFFDELTKLTKKLVQEKGSSTNFDLQREDQVSVIKSKIAQGFVSSNVSIKQGVTTDVKGVDSEYSALVDRLTKEKKAQDAKRFK